jgi:hypothetical protein
MSEPRLIADGQEFIRLWRETEKRQQREMDEWIAFLRQRGIVGAHPNDGWVDREKQELILTYPQFNDGIAVGKRMALGSPHQFVVVEITGVRSGITGLKYWSYEEILEDE